MSIENGTQRRPHRWPQPLAGLRPGIWYGGDYNPEQWPEQVWDDDVRLMREAGVNLVSVGIFSWARLQPAPDRWDFDWLDAVIAKLGAAGIAVDLASATATAPLWLYKKHPEVLPRGPKGEIINPGSRQSWRPTSPVFREYALEMCRRMAEHYRDSPTVVAWHLGNEYGWNNHFDYSDDALQAFQQWCENRYHTVDAVNEAWGTAFWSQSITSFDEILIPRYFGAATSFVNPSQFLDFQRFSSDALKDFYCAERDVIESICPDKPLTTNFMISTDQAMLDYEDWSNEVDFVSNDHYFKEGLLHLDELTCSDSFVDAISHRKPWMLMENSTSAVNWKSVNARKKHGELIRDSLAHVASGSDGILFFQWRQSGSGAEAFHSAMVPHAGEDSQVFRDVCELGKMLKQLSDEKIQGTEVIASSVAIIFDINSQWALENKTLPSTKVDHWHDVRDWYRALLDNGLRADVVPLSEDWSHYETLILPSVFMLTASTAQRLEDYVQHGGHLIVTYATGIVDESFHVGLKGYPAALSSLIGVRAEEFNILGDIPGEPRTIGLSNGFTTSLWQNVITSIADDTEVLATYEGEEADDWDIEGLPAITRHPYGQGAAYYLGCDTEYHDKVDFFSKTFFSHEAVPSWQKKPKDGRILHLVRQGGGYRFDFYFNRTKKAVELPRRPESVLLTYRCETEPSSSSFTLERNGAIVTKTECS